MPLLFALLLLLLQGPVSAAPAPSFQEIEESLTCQCGCGLTVHSCNHLQCPSAIPLRQEIREQMAKGLGRGEILAYFQQKYGEKILSSPTTTGFNLAAWVTPFALLLLGTAFVVVTLRRWRRRGAHPPSSDTPAAPTGGSRNALERELDRELRELDE
ncbi:MAG TPA: cytochrome c-type biogenesis protein CcmH [Candidatus Dormibacteraeota bacterium]|nr:cytochrome c-type biogenesis protein CcmH [Candidatus Dormibacteraeota bacterium]